jgi:hypothetical protein
MSPTLETIAKMRAGRAAAHAARKLNPRPGWRKAIDAKCKDCGYDPFDVGAWREQVERCTCTDCPLFPLRPRSFAAGASSSEGNPNAKGNPSDSQLSEGQDSQEPSTRCEWGQNGGMFGTGQASGDES